ncbi:hypothetical protein [Roseobacter sp. HKCCA0434]|uniref:hypothetical protein n=1 Tax=Roseobacter sp. HKCCA0434 TaxID=3079297 RepID=UPI002905B2C9|nr:hypothetical protein [Roseobacter sp. HKCCA0434]
MTILTKALAATTALTLAAAPLAAQTSADVTTTGKTGSSRILLQQDADNSVDTVGDAAVATGDAATDLVGGAVDLVGDTISAGGDLISAGGNAIADIINGPGADITTTATVYRVVPATELDARLATGSPTGDLDNATLIGSYVSTLDGTTIGRIDEVERTEAGALQTLSLNTAATEAEVNLTAEATYMVDDGIVLALTDAEFVEVVNAVPAD